MGRLPAAALILGLSPAAVAAPAVALADPEGDDDGSGTVTYPTGTPYAKGSFDLLKLEAEDKGDDVEFRIGVNARIEDPWNSKDWGGNGFSLQMAFVFIDQDHKEGSGETRSPPGLNLAFPKDGGWEKAVIVSPQSKTRLSSEINQKAKDLKGKLVIPRRTSARGRELIAVVSKKDLGGSPKPGWGYQVAIQSNEGYPDKSDLLTRKVNEYGGEHRFGGGKDGDCDPHVIDILAGAGKGEPGEAKAQHDALGAYSCNDDGTPKALAVAPMIYP